MAIDSIAIAMLHGARQQPACEVIGITVRTLQYWRIGGLTDQRQIVKKEPTNKLSKLERENILAVCKRRRIQEPATKTNSASSC